MRPPLPETIWPKKESSSPSPIAILCLGLPPLTPLLQRPLRAAPTSLEFTPRVVSTTPWTSTAMATLVAMVVAAEIATCLLPTHQMSHYQTPLSLPPQLQLRTPCSFLHRRSRR